MQRWEPFRELEQLQEATAELLENVWSGAGVPNGGRIWTPLVDIEETDEAWIVEAELPGVDRKDVSVELRDSELAITGEIKERERKGLLRRRTRYQKLITTILVVSGLLYFRATERNFADVI